jgi:hypothetical protein
LTPDAAEQTPLLGGKCSELEAEYRGRLDELGKEIHHIPPTDSSGIPRADGMAILMDKADHRALTSTGSSDDAGGHREDEEMHIDDGDMKAAVDLEICDIQERFGDKYDEAIRQMLERGMWEVPRAR